MHMQVRMHAHVHVRVCMHVHWDVLTHWHVHVHMGIVPLTFRGFLGPFQGDSGPRTTDFHSIPGPIIYSDFWKIWLGYTLARISLAGAHSPHWSLGLSPLAGWSS